MGQKNFLKIIKMINETVIVLLSKSDIRYTFFLAMQLKGCILMSLDTNKINSQKLITS